MSPAGALPLRPLVDPAVREVALVRLRVGLGDLLASLPAIRAVKQARPDIRMTMITWAEVAPIVGRMSSYVDDLLPFPGYPGIPERPPRLAELPAFIRAARRRSFDLAVQMYGWQPAANDVTDAVPARIHAGFYSPDRRERDRSTFMPYPYGDHEIHRHMRLMRFLGVPAEDDRMEFPLSERDMAEADRLLERCSITPFAYACVHPGATAESRRWPPARFAVVADALAQAGLRVVLIGTRAEAPLTAEVARAMRCRVVDLAGETTLGGLGALLRKSAALVGNDSGPAHVAVALGVPSVTLFMAGERRRWRGLNGSLHAALEAGVECQPCSHQVCPIDFRCATRLRTEAVIAAAQRVLRRTPPLDAVEHTRLSARMASA